MTDRAPPWVARRVRREGERAGILEGVGCARAAHKSVVASRDPRNHTADVLRLSVLPDEMFVSVVTLAELQAGGLAAPDTATRALRLATLESIAVLGPLPIDSAAAAQWAVLRARLAEEGRRIDVNDLWLCRRRRRQRPRDRDPRR